MAEEVAIDLNIKTGEAEKNTQSLKSKLKELKQQLAGLEEGSAAFNKIAAEAGKVQDKIGDLNKRVNNLASDTRKLDVVVGVAQGIAGGFAAAQGAAALFGAENEDLNKTLLKVQGSVALLNGVQQIANTLNKDSAVMTNLNTAAQTAYTFVVGTSTGALKLFRIALASTGIGLIIIAIGELIAHWEDLTKWIGKSTEAADKHAAATKADTEAMKEQSKVLSKQAKDDLQLAIAQWQQVKEIRAQQGLDTLKADEKIRELRLLAGATETELKLEQIKSETAQTVEALKDRQAKEVELQKQKDAEKLQAEKDAAQEKEDWLAERKQADEEAMAFEDELRKERQAEIAEETKQELADEEAAAKAKIDLAKKVAEEKQKSIDDTFMLTKNSLAATQGLSDIFYQNQLAQNAGNDKKMREIKKKQFETNKIFTVSSIVLDTIMGMMKAIASNPPPSPIGIAGAVITGIAGTAATIKALAAKFDGGASGSFSPPSANVNTGTTSTAPNNFAPQIPQTPQSIPVPQQVYVTETDITGVQGKVNVIENLAKIH